MTKLINVKWRENAYHFRMGVPADLRKHYGRTEHTASLNTSDELEASKKAGVLTAKYKAEHKALRSSAQKKPATKAPASVFDVSKAEDSFKRVKSKLEGLETSKLRTVYSQVDKLLVELQNALQSVSGLSLESLEMIRLTPVLNRTLLELCQQVCGEKNLSDDSLRRKTARYTIQFLNKHLQEIKEAIPPLTGGFNNKYSSLVLAPDGTWQTAPSPISTPPQTTAQQDKEIPLLSSVLEKHINKEDMGAGAEEELRFGAMLFIEWAGDKPVSEYSVDDLVDYRNNCLRKLPKNRNKKKKYEGKTLRQAIKLGSSDEHIGKTRINNLLSRVHTVFQYALKNSLGELKLNPASDLKLPKSKSSKKNDRSFSDDELKKLFKILTYNEKNPSWYWAVMISLHNSFRQNEICQLHTFDIIKVDGIFCFDINEDDAAMTKKHVKNHASCRVVPMHPKLIEAGFIGYVEHRRKQLKKENGLLFSNVTYTDSKDKYSRSTGRWFNERFKGKFISPDIQAERKRDFHSLRHTFGRYAKNRAKMNKSAERVLMGHGSSKDSEVHDGYTVEEIQFLFDELKKLDYGLVVPTNPFME